MKVQDLVNAMEHIAPLRYAESWDKVGLHLGDPSRQIVGSIFLTIDLTERVLDEAIELGAGAIIAYHPPIFTPLSTLTDATHTERIIRKAAESKIAIYSPHTALDATSDGITDWLCEGISAEPAHAAPGSIHGDIRALAPAPGGDHERAVKVITFVPTDEVDQLRKALGTAGAGGIGNYQLVSFNTAGEGTFLPVEGAHPKIGQIGSLERVQETRIEMVCSRRALAMVVETLKEFHPYETPAYDIIELVPEPIRKIGAGRRLVLDQPATIHQLADRLKAHLGRARVRFSLAENNGNSLFETIAVVPGSGGSMTKIAREQGCELFITGEMTHHAILEANQAGLSVLLAGHTNTERGYLPRLQSKLASALDQEKIILSQTDLDEIRIG